jgi:hypothetical protein
MADKHMTADMKDVALVIECRNCGASLDVTAKAAEDKQGFVGGACFGCGSTLFPRDAVDIACLKRLLEEHAEYRLRIRVAVPTVELVTHGG